MKTISHEGKRYKIAHILDKYVVIDLPEIERWGMYSRIPIPFSQFSKSVVSKLLKSNKLN